MTITTKDGIAVQLEIGQVFTTPEECDLIGRTFSDGRKTGVVKRVEMTLNEDWWIEAKLVFGQNYVNVWDAYQACETCFAKMEWVNRQTNHFGEPVDYEEVYSCSVCGEVGEQANGNVINGYELPI